MMTAPFLYALYKDLARDQPLLGTSLHEYYALLELVSSGHYPIRSFADLQFVLESLWAKSYEQRGLLREQLAARRHSIEEWISGLKQELATTASGGRESGKAPSSGEGSAATATRKPEREKTVVSQVPQLEPQEETERPAIQGQAAKTGFSINRKHLPQQALAKLRHSQAAPIPINQTPFHFGDEYHPVKNRHLQQAWRTLKNNRPGPLSTVVDFDKTIVQTAKQGYLSTLHYIRHEYNHMRLILLLDQGANMVAVESFGRELLDAARESKWHDDLQAWYFQRVPRLDKRDGDYVFFNAASTNRTTLHGILQGINKKDIAAIIYSDAGAINFEYGEQRSREWLDFARLLRQRVGHLAWINPAPRHRWEASNAGKIAGLVPMFESDRHGIEGAIAVLKGKPILNR